MVTKRGRDTFNKYKPILLIISKAIRFLPLKVRIALLTFFRNIDGKIGIAIRYVLLKAIAIKCGDNVSVHAGVYIFSPEKLSIGNNVSIHPMCYIDASGEIVINNDVSIAHSSTILSSEHNYGESERPIKEQGIKFKRTIIKSNVWIACGVRILAGTQVNEGTIVAAGAVVKNTLQSNFIYGGIPAKSIKGRVI